MDIAFVTWADIKLFTFCAAFALAFTAVVTAKIAQRHSKSCTISTRTALLSTALGLIFLITATVTGTSTVGRSAIEGYLFESGYDVRTISYHVIEGYATATVGSACLLDVIVLPVGDSYQVFDPGKPSVALTPITATKDARCPAG